MNLRHLSPAGPAMYTEGLIMVHLSILSVGLHYVENMRSYVEFTLPINIKVANIKPLKCKTPRT